ncbi:20522_t:CDS:2, partial [Racocetra persica]
MTESNQKALQLPSKSGSEQVNRIQRDFNRLTDEISKLKKENEELKKNNSETLENELKKIEQQIEKCLDALRAEYNRNASLDIKINELVELCKEFGEELSTFRNCFYVYTMSTPQSGVLNSIKALKEENEKLKKQINDKNNENNALNQKLEN